MARKKREPLVMSSRDARFELHRLLNEEGLYLDDALKRALPDDNNPKKTYQTWREKGIWPLSKQELLLYEECAEERSSDNEAPNPEISDSSDTAAPRPPTTGISETSESPRPERKRTDGFLTDDHIEQIKDLVRKEVQKIMEAQRTTRTDVRDVPPSPSGRISTEGRGRPVNPGGRVKLAGTVDVELERLFREECTKRGMSVSRLLDTVIWHFFGKPRLSFETSDNSE